jgi:hypothetical protein
MYRYKNYCNIYQFPRIVKCIVSWMPAIAHLGYNIENTAERPFLGYGTVRNHEAIAGSRDLHG